MTWLSKWFCKHLDYIVLFHSFPSDLKQNLPSLCLLTVHTALGEPGSSETAISATSSPCLNALIEDLDPRPHAKYTCGVSSPARSATWHAEIIINPCKADGQRIYEC